MNRIASLMERRLSRKFSVHSASYKLPTYQHDQCERSLYMHLFAMRKTDLTLVLILTVAFGAFCIMLASLAPDSTIVERLTLDLFGTNSELYHINSAIGANLDLDLESQSDRSQERIVAQAKTRPLSVLNRELNFRVQLAFGISLEHQFSRSQSSQLQNNKTDGQMREPLIMLNVSYNLELILEPVIQLIAQDDINNSNNDNENEGFLMNGDDVKYDEDYGHRDTAEKPPRLNGSNFKVTDSSQQSSQSLRVSFGCRVDTTKETNQISALNRTSKPPNFRLKCWAPNLSARRKIERHQQTDRRAYKLTIIVGDISLQAKRINGDGSSSGIANRIRLDWIRPALKLRHINSSFTILTNLTHLLYVLISITVACSFMLCLSDYRYELWSLEQKWTALMLVLLVGANKPMSTLEILITATTGTSSSASKDFFEGEAVSFERLELVNDNDVKETEAQDGCQDYETFLAPLPRSNIDLFDSILGLNFLCGLLLSWTCFAHSIRQISRPFWQFYAPKLAPVLALWLVGASAILYDSGRLRWQARLAQSLVRLDVALQVGLAAYFLQLVYHFAVSAIELRPMSYFSIRFRVQALLCAWILINYTSIILMGLKVPAAGNSRPSDLGEKISGRGSRLSALSSSNGNDKIENINAALLNSSIGLHRLPDNSSNNNVTVGEDPGAAELVLPTTTTNYSSTLSPIVQLAPTGQTGQGNKDDDDNRQRRGPANVLALLPQYHTFDSACSFLCYIFLNNLYVMACAYFYWPMVRQSPVPCKLLPSRHTNELDSDSAILEDLS